MNEFKAKNETEIQNIVKALNFGKNGRIIIDGVFEITKPIKFTAPVHIKGTPGSKLLISNKVSRPFSWSGSRSKPYSLSIKDRFTESFKTDGPIKTGDFVTMYADNVLDIAPHYKEGGQHPGEIHQVNYVGTDEAYTSDLIIDEMTENARLRICSPLQNIIISDLNLGFTGEPQRNYAAVFDFRYCNNVRVENVNVDRFGPGAFNFHHCTNVYMDSVTIGGTYAQDIVYGIVVSTVNGVNINNCNISGTRHAFTTTAGSADARKRKRWGTALNTKIFNCLINVPTKDNGVSRIGLDTHSEGYGIIFDGCTINVGGNTTNVGGQTRSRNTIFKDCIVTGGRVSKGLRTYAKNTVFTNCIFDNMWYSIGTFGDYANSSIITNNIFKNTRSSPIFLKDGDNHTVKNNVFINTAYKPNRNMMEKEVQVGSGKDHDIS